MRPPRTFRIATEQTEEPGEIGQSQILSIEEKADPTLLDVPLARASDSDEETVHQPMVVTQSASVPSAREMNDTVPGRSAQRHAGARAFSSAVMEQTPVPMTTGGREESRWNLLAGFRMRWDVVWAVAMVVAAVLLLGPHALQLVHPAEPVAAPLVPAATPASVPPVKRESPVDVAVVDAPVAAPGEAPAPCPDDMVAIGAGDVVLGSSHDDPMRGFGDDDLRTVAVAAFCIDRDEYGGDEASPPRVRISWTDAQVACVNGKRRLCTEAEWERACKGPQNLRFPYGASFESGLCNTENDDGSARSILPAMGLQRCRSAFGVRNLSGNVEEWIADSQGDGGRIAKGGAADRPDWASRCAARRGLPPTQESSTLGFRCCRAWAADALKGP